MLQFIVKFLVSRLSADDLIELGSSLTEAGRLAVRRQAAIANALAHVREGVDALAD